MKRLVGIALLVAASLTLTPHEAAASGSCGIPPIPPMPPIGCSAMAPVCTCDGRGNCWWTFQCVR